MSNLFEPTALTWCPDCRRLVSTHPLIHQIDEHAPRLGNRHANWRTAELKARRDKSPLPLLPAEAGICRFSSVNKKNEISIAI